MKSLKPITAFLAAGVIATGLFSATVASADEPELNWWKKTGPSVAGSNIAAQDLGVNSFERVGTFFVDTQTPKGTGAEIIAATPDGNTLIYTDAGANQVGFVNIYNTAAPAFIGALDAPGGGEPTSVAVTPSGQYALVAVIGGDENYLWVINIGSRTTAALIPLNGQPDSVAVSPDGRYAALAIENQRPDEDIPFEEQDPIVPGFLVIADLVGAPSTWGIREVSLVGIADRFPADPEPEFVDINAANQAVVTLQENNHIVIVNLRDGSIISEFSAGLSSHKADLRDNGSVSFSDQLSGARREPDGVTWLPYGFLAVASEGDYDLDLDDGEFTGGRDFAVFTPSGQLFSQSGSSLERAVAAAGLYPDGRSDAKGIEPESAEVGTYGWNSFLFIGGERCGCVIVYKLIGGFQPKFVQVLDVGTDPTEANERPEGLVAVPQRNLFVVANEGDDGDPSGTISIFKGTSTLPPTMEFATD